MLKKTFIITILTAFIFSSVFIMPKERAAANPLVIPAGAGVYALAVLGGATVMYGLGEAAKSEEMVRHAEDVWNKTTSATRNAINQSLSWVKSNTGVQTDVKIDFSKLTITQQDLVREAGRAVSKSISHSVSYEHAASLVTFEPYTPSTLPPDYNYIEQSTMFDSSVAFLSTSSGMVNIAGFEDDDPWAYKVIITTPSADFYYEGYYKRFEFTSTGINYDGGVRHNRDTDGISLNTYANSTLINTGTDPRIHLMEQGALPYTPEAMQTAIHLANDLSTDTKVTAQIVNYDWIKKNPIIESRFQEQWETVQDAGLVIPQPAIQQANPDLVFNPDGTVTDGAGTVVQPGDVAVPKPDVINDRIAIPNPAIPGTGTDATTGETVGNPTDVTNPPTTGDGDGGILQGLWDWLKGILQAILDAIKAIAAALGVLGLLESIINFLSNIWSGLQSILGALSPLEILQGILSKIGEILSYLNPFSENFFLWLAFVPSAGFFSAYWSEIYNAWLDKLPIMAQLFGFLDSVKDSTIGQKIPEFKITLPKDMGGQTLPVVSFAYFTDYRNIIINFIRFTAWFIFIKRIWSKLPRVVY